MKGRTPKKVRKRGEMGEGKCHFWWDKYASRNFGEMTVSGLSQKGGKKGEEHRKRGVLGEGGLEVRGEGKTWVKGGGNKNSNPQREGKREMASWGLLD